MFEPHVYGCMNWVSFPMYGRLNLISSNELEEEAGLRVSGQGFALKDGGVGNGGGRHLGLIFGLSCTGLRASGDGFALKDGGVGNGGGRHFQARYRSLPPISY